MDNTRERGKRERNPITGDGMKARDSQGTIHHFKSEDHLPQRDVDTDTDKSSIFSEEEIPSVTTLKQEENIEGTGEIESRVSSMTLDKVNSTPTMTSKEKLTCDTNNIQTPARTQRQRQRERNPITGAGMQDRDYRSIVPSFKIHGPQRKESNPLNFEGSVDNDKEYQSDVQDACISPLTRNEEKKAATVEERPETSFIALNKPVSRQRQRDRNPITGDGMVDRDFRVQIPTFKIHGPQRQSGDPLTGDGYSKNDNDYQRQVQDACDSPLSSPDNGGKSRFETRQ